MPMDRHRCAGVRRWEDARARRGSLEVSTPYPESVEGFSPHADQLHHGRSPAVSPASDSNCSRYVLSDSEGKTSSSLSTRILL